MYGRADNDFDNIYEVLGIVITITSDKGYLSMVRPLTRNHTM